MRAVQQAELGASTASVCQWCAQGGGWDCIPSCRDPTLHSTSRAQLPEQMVPSSSITMSNVQFAREWATLAEEILNISLERMQKG